MITRKELAKAAKRTFKKHFWILVVVCLIAAFVGSEFTETFSFFKMQMTDINKDTNEAQGVTLVTSDIDNRTKSAMLDAIVSVIMNNEEQGKEQSRRHLSTKQRIMQGTYWGELREYYRLLLIMYRQEQLCLL